MPRCFSDLRAGDTLVRCEPTSLPSDYVMLIHRSRDESYLCLLADGRRVSMYKSLDLDESAWTLFSTGDSEDG